MTVSVRDYIIVGGGLQGGLLALAIRHRQPNATVLLLERGSRSGGNHTWSFHANDLPVDAQAFVNPLIVATWPRYWVRFPGYSRLVESPYSSISSERFAEVLANCGCELLTNIDAEAMNESMVRTTCGREFRARCVLDARGGTVATLTHKTGYQKFIGWEIETERPWPVEHPIIMDADLPQDDGYRFLYELPFNLNRVLIEDTYFADGPELFEDVLRDRIRERIHESNIGAWRLIREESGVLPMPWSGGGIDLVPPGPLKVGAAGGWFHPATGYSFPIAVRLALAIANTTPDKARAAATELAKRMSPRQRFARFLNRLLFTIVKPSERRSVFRRLYRTLPDSLMNRFYALEFGAVDALRMVVGWPPPLALSRLFFRPEARLCSSPISSH